MKYYVLDFLKRGLLAAAGGPVILAVVYGSLGASGAIAALTPGEVCRAILMVTLMAFIAGGVSIVYQIEKLPLLPATFIHALALYTDYLLIYLLNGWLSGGLAGVAVFTAIFGAGYALIWLVIITSIKVKTKKINEKLRGDKA